MTHRCLTPGESPEPYAVGWLPKDRRERIAAHMQNTGSVPSPAAQASEFQRTLNIIIEAVSSLPGAITLINRRLEEELQKRAAQGILDPRPFNFRPDGQDRRT